MLNPPNRSARLYERNACWRWLAPGAAVVALSMTSGCYERVIKAKGLGAAGVSVQKPYASNTMLDDAVMGPRPGPEKRKVKSSNWESTNK